MELQVHIFALAEGDSHYLAPFTKTILPCLQVCHAIASALVTGLLPQEEAVLLMDSSLQEQNGASLPSVKAVCTGIIQQKYFEYSHPCEHTRLSDQQ